MVHITYWDLLAHGPNFMAHLVLKAMYTMLDDDDHDNIKVSIMIYETSITIIVRHDYDIYGPNFMAHLVRNLLTGDRQSLSCSSSRVTRATGFAWTWDFLGNP